MHRRWFVNRTNSEYIGYLSRSSGVSEALAQVLINRGIKTPDDVKAFLNPSAASTLPPLTLLGMDKAVDAIGRAIKAGEKILVHGDYDADGLSASAILLEALKSLGAETLHFIPNRFRNGYGLSAEAVDLALSEGAGLLVTVDCGISSFDSAKYAASKGLGVVVTDHHEPATDGNGGVLFPDALAVVNPKLPGNPEGSDILSGAGVALKLAEALGLETGKFMDLAALGTLADVVPLIGENRRIVNAGLPLLRAGQRPGIRALMQSAGMGHKKFRPSLLSYTVLPRLNAPGRLGEAAEALGLLMSVDEQSAIEIARRLDALNIERQKVEETVLTEALGMLQGVDPGPAIVLAGDGWHEGVLGIVASKLTERFGKPSFVISIKGKTAKGSARSIPAFDIHAGLAKCADMLAGFGGHKQAAGLRLNASDIGRFHMRICGIVESEVRDFTPVLRLDADIGLNEVTFGLVGELENLGPHGHGNPEPIFGSRALEVVGPRVVGQGHLKMRLRSGSVSVDAIGFDMADFMEHITEGSLVDAAFNATINEWEDRRILQLNLKALRPASA